MDDELPLPSLHWLGYELSTTLGEMPVEIKSPKPSVEPIVEQVGDMIGLSDLSSTGAVDSVNARTIGHVFHRLLVKHPP